MRQEGQKALSKGIVSIALTDIEALAAGVDHDSACPLSEPLMVIAHPVRPKAFLLIKGEACHAQLLAAGAKSARCRIVTRRANGSMLPRRRARRRDLRQLMMSALERSKGKVACDPVVEDVATRSIMSAIARVTPIALELLLTTGISLVALRRLGTVKPERQLEIVNLLTASGNFSVQFVRLLCSASAENERCSSGPQRRTIDESGKERDFARARETAERLALVDSLQWVADGLELAVCDAFVDELLRSRQVFRYLCAAHPKAAEVLAASRAAPHALSEKITAY